MSLVCGECGGALGKSESLPGREGTLVHPVLRVISDVKELQRGAKCKPKYSESEENIALCFECIERNIPEPRKEVLQQIYCLFEMEMNIKEQEKLEKATLLTDHHLSQLNNLRTLFAAELEPLKAKCLLTGTPVGEGIPYFTINAIDRVNSSKGQGLFGPTYQIFGKICESDLKIPISFNAFRKTFPELFKNLSCFLQKIDNPDAKPRTNDLYLGPGIKEELEKSMGKPIDELIVDMAKGGGNLRVIYPHRKRRSRR